MNIIKKYQNGNNVVRLYDNGTRIIEGDMKFIYPLNIDIRVSNKCAFGQREDGTFVLCSFCHESAKVNGIDCDYELLKSKLIELPPIELAIGCNEFTTDLYDFLTWAKPKFVCNITINSGHVKRDEKMILKAIENNIIKGLGVSYRKNIKIPNWLREYNDCVLHVIAGIDDIEEVKKQDFNKVLVLGCKDFGFNLGKVNQEKIKEWYRKIPRLFNKQVCFDNLAIEQLNMKRFFNDKNWNVYNQGEESFYIDAVRQIYAPSSRDQKSVNWDKYSIPEYYKSLKND